ncbi:MAG: A24 family peptidase [Chloroflexota bacterium]
MQKQRALRSTEKEVFWQMAYFIMLLVGLLAGWLINLAVDTIPDRLPFFSGWYRPFYKLPTVLVKSITEPLLGPIPTNSPDADDEGKKLAPSLRHQAVWVGSILLGWLTYFHFGFSLTTLAMTLYAWFFLAIAAIDLEQRKVYNRMLLAALPVILLFTPFIEGPTLLSALVGGLFGFILFLILALIKPGGMGMGDVKLAGVIGLVTGFPGIIVAILICIFSGGVMAALLLLRTKFKRGQTMAYAPYLVLGAWVTLFYGSEIWATYLAR